MKRFLSVLILSVTLSMMTTFAQDKATSSFRTTSLLSSEDSLQLSVLYSLPPTGKEPEGVLQIVHGMCEHKERYIPFMEFMSKNGWICVIHDHRGHGASVRYPNELGYFYEGGYNAMIHDVKVIADWIKSEFEGLDINMLGHSMGSMVVRSYLKKNDEQIEKLIVCGSPSYDPASRIGIKQTKRIIEKYGGMARPTLIQKMSFSSFNKKFKMEGSPNAWICSDMNIVKAYDKDPLCSYQFTANGFYNLFSLMQYTYDEAGWNISKPDLPIHFISGEEDPCIGTKAKFEKAVYFLKKIGYKNVSSKLYPHMRHEILNEKDKQTVWDDVLRFLSE